MKQAELVSPKTIEIKEVPKPIPNENQVLLKIHAVGICGSDIHAWHGKHPFISCPIVTGHEATGEVVELGANVTNVKLGDRVVIRPQSIDGTCTLCKEDRYNICNSLQVLGCQITGASSDYYAVNADLLYVFPDNIGYGEGTVIEPLAVGVHAARRGIPDGNFAGKKALVIGAGTIGNMVAQALLGLGAADVIITDISDEKLKIAQSCGIKHTVNSKQTDLDAAVKALFGPDGADVSYECTASAAGLNQLLDISRKGTRIVIVGVYGDRVNVNMANVQDREYELIGTLMYKDADYQESIKLVSESKVNLKGVITHEFPLEKTAEAYQFIDANRDAVQKVIIIVNQL